MRYRRYPRYIPVAKKKAKAAEKLNQLLKKNPGVKPVVLEGHALARTWWGKSWNVNLERYADYSNRIGRGRSYVRHGAVLDLQINSGKVKSLVQGTASKPYSVIINIEGIDKKIWRNIQEACEGQLESLSELLMGKFPQALGEIFTTRGKGLFPSPQEIEFSCSCPDWASMCKHVAATLYGVGARLDEDPNLFFKLRKVEVGDLISQAVENKTQKLLKKAEKKSSRVIDDSDISNIFGIEMDEPIDFGTEKGKAARKTSIGNKTAGKAEADPGKTTLKAKSPKAESKRPAQKTTAGMAMKAPARPAPAKRKITPKLTEEKPLKSSINDSALGMVGRNGARLKGKPSFDAMINHFIRNYDIPTKHDFEKLHDRLDALERLIHTKTSGQNKPEFDGNAPAGKASRNKSLKRASDAVLDIIRESREGVGFAEIQSRTGFEDKKIRNIIFRLNAIGEIQRKARGIYIAS